MKTTTRYLASLLLAVALFGPLGCGRMVRSLVPLVNDAIVLAIDVVWVAIAVTADVIERGVHRLDVTVDGDLSVVRGYDETGRMVFDDGMAGVEAPATLRCEDVDARLSASLVAVIDCDGACDDLRLSLHVTAREAKACR